LPPFDQAREEEVGPLRLRGGANGKEETPDDEVDVGTEADHQASEKRSRPIDNQGEGADPCSSTADHAVRSRSPHGIRTRSKSAGAYGQTTKTRKRGGSTARADSSDVTAKDSSSDNSDRWEIAPLRKRTEAAENIEATEQPGHSGTGKRRALQPLEPVDLATTTSGEQEQEHGPRGDRRDSTMDSSSEEEKARKGQRKKKQIRKRYGPDAFKKAKRNGTAGSEGDSERIARLRAECAGKRGRPPTTGEYVKLAAAKKAVNDERERERRLEREARTFEMSEILDILRSSKLYPEEEAEHLAHNPTGDIASRIREAQAEVVRISRISSNLKGDLQRALRVSASLTLGAIEVLRTRADITAKKTGQEEVRGMRERLDYLSKAQNESDRKLMELTSELEATKAAMKEERTKRESVLRQMRDITLKNETLKAKLSEERAKHKEELRRARNTRPEEESPTHTEPMEVEVPQPPPTAESAGDTAQPPTYATATAARPKITRRDLEEFPAMRPAVQGKRVRIPDRDLPPPGDREGRDGQKSVQEAKEGREQRQLERNGGI